jgi:hypothetical protein
MSGNTDIRQLQSLCDERDALVAENQRLTHERDFLQRELGFKNTLRQENQRLRDALETACDVAIWMSGASAFAPDGEAAEHWPKQRERLYTAMEALPTGAALPGTPSEDR